MTTPKESDIIRKEIIIKIVLTEDAGDSIPGGILRDIQNDDCVCNATLYEVK